MVMGKCKNSCVSNVTMLVKFDVCEYNTTGENVQNAQKF